MLALVAEAVFTGESRTPLIEGGALLIDGGIIRQVGPAKHVVKKSMTRIDVEGVVLPGLIDAHTHVCLSASADPGRDIANEHPTRTTARAIRSLQQHVDAGVTTIRDVGGVHGIDLELSRLQREGFVEGPEVFAAGRLVCMTGGHACFLGIEVDGGDEARKAARSQLKAGARLLKVIATGGIITEGVRPGAAQLTVAEMRAVCEEAAKAQKVVAAHAQGSEGIENALEAGCHSIEHGFWLSDRAIRTMKQQGRVLVPTFAALRTMRARADQLPAFIRDKLDEVERPQMSSFKRAVAAGVVVACGTDAGTPFNPHGNIKEELAAFSEAGLDHESVWRAATTGGAAALGIDDRGVLTPNRRADVIAVSRDVFQDPRQYDRPRLVMQRGEVLRGPT